MSRTSSWSGRWLPDSRATLQPIRRPLAVDFQDLRLGHARNAGIKIGDFSLYLAQHTRGLFGVGGRDQRRLSPELPRLVADRNLRTQEHELRGDTGKSHEMLRNNIAGTGACCLVANPGNCGGRKRVD